MLKIRKHLFFLIGIAYCCSVYFITSSLSAALAYLFSAILVWFFVVNIMSILNPGEFRLLFNKYSIEEAFPESELHAEGYMFLDNRYKPAGVLVNEQGIYVYSVGLCECKILWKSVFGIKQLTLNNMLVANIFLTCGFKREKNFFIPWRQEFNSCTEAKLDIGEMVVGKALYKSFNEK